MAHLLRHQVQVVYNGYENRLLVALKPKGYSVTVKRDGIVSLAAVLGAKLGLHAHVFKFPVKLGTNDQGLLIATTDEAMYQNILRMVKQGLVLRKWSFILKRRQNMGLNHATSKYGASEKITNLCNDTFTSNNDGNSEESKRQILHVPNSLISRDYSVDAADVDHSCNVASQNAVKQGGLLRIYFNLNQVPPRLSQRSLTNENIGDYKGNDWKRLSSQLLTQPPSVIAIPNANCGAHHLDYCMQKLHGTRGHMLHLYTRDALVDAHLQHVMSSLGFGKCSLSTRSGLEFPHPIYKHISISASL